MRMGVFSMRATLAAALLGGVTLHLWAQVPAPAAADQTRNPLSGDPQAITKGAVLFRQECVYCHGVGARGGMRGPDLTTGSWNHGGSDADLVRTITDGVAGTAMPPNNLKTDEIWQIVSYLRTRAAAGRRRRSAIRRAARRCSSAPPAARPATSSTAAAGGWDRNCTTVGSARSRAYLVESIRQPSKQLTEIRALGERLLEVRHRHRGDRRTAGRSSACR